MAKEKGEVKEELEQEEEKPQEVSGETDKAKGPAVESEKAKQPADYEKTQQQLDRERANLRRAKAALAEAQAQREELAGQVTGLQTQMTDLQKQLKDQLSAKEYANLANLDPDTTEVPDLVKAFQGQTAKLQKLEADNASMREYVEDLKAREQQEQVTKAKSEVEEEIYSTCDEDYGAQFRNEAIAMADKLVDDGEVDPPRTQMQGLKLMRKCYAEAAKKHAKPDKPKAQVPTDTGLHGLSVADIEDSEEFKPGTLDQVKADMAKKMKAGKWRKAFGGPS